jgi:hypothetical protein
MEAGRWPKEALRFSHQGSRGVGRPKVTDWCGNVNPLLSRSSTPEYYKVIAQAKGQPALRGYATPQSRITRRRTVSLEVDTG